MHGRTSKFALLALSAATFSTATPTLARDRTVVVRGILPQDQIRRTVSYRDLNLASSSGAQMLNRRVHNAVNDLCDEAVGPNATLRVETKCQQDSWGGARPQIAQAIERAKQLAATGKSTIAAVAITISINP